MKDYRMLLDAEDRALERMLRMRQMILEEMRELRDGNGLGNAVDAIRQLREIEDELSDGRREKPSWLEAIAAMAMNLLAGRGHPPVGLAAIPQPMPLQPQAAEPSPTPAPAPYERVPSPPSPPEPVPSETPKLSEQDMTLVAWHIVLADALESDMEIDLVADMVVGRTAGDERLRVLMTNFTEMPAERIVALLAQFKPSLKATPELIARIEELRMALKESMV